MNQDPHVVVIIPRFFPYWGGSEIRMRRIMQALMARGFRFTVLTRRMSRETARQENLDGIDVVRLPKWRPLFRASVRHWLSTHRTDVSLVHTVRLDVMGALGAWARAHLSLPHMAEIITYEVPKLQRKGKSRLLKKIFAGTDCVHCLSEDTADAVRAEGVAAEKIWLRGNAVDSAHFCPSCLKRADIHPVTVLCCGRLERQKGTDVLMKAWKMLPAEVAGKAQLLLAGSGRWDEKIRKCAEGLANVRLIGTVAKEAMPELYRQAQIYVQPSRFEGMSNSILEAMASGLPLISTDIGANVGVIEDGVNGYKVPVEDAGALAEALTRLINDQGLRISLGQAGRKYAENRFSFAALYDDFEARYRALAETV